MISLRLAIPAVLIAAVVATCFTYLVSSRVSSPNAQVKADPLLPPGELNLEGRDTTASTSADQHPGADEKAAAAYLEAAKTILSRAPSARASARNDELPIMGRVPLPKKRPAALL